MGRSAQQVLADIHAFEPADGYWLPLDALVAELWDSGAAGAHAADLLSVFERFPEEEDAVLWGILHGLESLPDYEPVLARSVREKPSEMGVTMVGRLLNSGIWQVGGIRLVELLRDVAVSAAAPASVRESAGDWVRRHGEPANAAEGAT